MAVHILQKEFKGIFRSRYQLLALGALGGLLVLFMLPSDGVGVIFCPLKNLSGLDCPACGLTRSVSSLLHLDFGSSFAYHPLGGLALAGLLLIVSPLRLAERLAEHLAEQPGSSNFAGTLYRYRWQIVVALFVSVWALRLFTEVFSI